MDLNFTQMQEMQKELQAKYEYKWGGLSPAGARDHLLWMLAEVYVEKHERNMKRW